MRLLLPLVAVLLVLTSIDGRAQTSATDAVPAAPVVLELYTSQGCSSCPPADALIAELAERPDVIALALHVDYWDYLGWKDTFGRPEHTARQRNYAKAAHKRTIFTPEMIVQGADRVKGHDAAAIAGLIAAHRQAPAGAALSLERSGDRLTIRISPIDGVAVGPSDIHLVRFQPSEQVTIEAGENAGREVDYANIVTDWRTVGNWDGVTPLEFTLDAPGPEPVAVIVQETRMGPIVSAARAP